MEDRMTPAAQHVLTAALAQLAAELPHEGWTHYATSPKPSALAPSMSSPQSTATEPLPAAVAEGGRPLDAIVQLKLSPREFDLLRVAVQVRRDQQFRRGTGREGDAEATGESKRASRQEAAELSDLLAKLR